MDSTIQPYLDPNFPQLPEYVDNVQMVTWENVPKRQKQLMLDEKRMNTRTSKEEKLIDLLQKHTNPIQIE